MCANKLPFLVKKQERHFSHCVRKGGVPSRCNFTEKITLQKMSQKCPPRGDTLSIPILIHSVPPLRPLSSFFTTYHVSFVPIIPSFNCLVYMFGFMAS